MASIHEVKVYKWHLTKNMEMGWDTFLNKNRGDIYRLGIREKITILEFLQVTAYENTGLHGKTSKFFQ